MTGGGSTLGVVLATVRPSGLWYLQPERLGIPDGCHSQSLILYWMRLSLDVLNESPGALA